MHLPFTLFLTILVSILSYTLSAQERTLDIQFEQTGELTVEASLIGYTRSTSLVDGIKTIAIDWGDGNLETLVVSNGEDTNNDGFLEGEPLNEHYTKYIYTGTHSYSSPGTYTISGQDSGRGAGVINVNFPISINTPIYVEAEVRVGPFSDNNHSPVLLEAPIDFGYLNSPYVQIINAYDQDDDSIRYELITPLQDAGEPVPQYWDLSNTEGFPDLDPETGIFYWENPPQAGSYTFTFQITSYRNSQIQDQVIRDMTILIDDPGEDAQWPAISMDTPTEIVQEVAVGDTVLVNLESTDTPGQTVTFSSTSGLYDYFEEPALFTPVSGNPASATFQWIVREEHVRMTPYPVVFTATDDDEDGEYAHSQLVRYRVMAPLTNTQEPVADNLGLSIFPNPSTGLVNVQWSGGERPVLEYQLINAQGRVLQSGQLDRSTPTLNLQHLPAACYWLRVKDEATVRSDKIILLAH